MRASRNSVSRSPSTSHHESDREAHLAHPRGKKICHECRHRKRPCKYENEDEACNYCKRKGVVCGEKIPKQQWLNRDGPPHPEMFQMQASTFIDFWIKSMRIHNPVAREEDLLAAFKQSIVQKEQQVSLKRGHKVMEEPVTTQTTTPGESPPPAKRRFTESEDLVDSVAASPMVTHVYAPTNTPLTDEPIITGKAGSIFSSGPPTVAITRVDQVGISPDSTLRTSSERDQFLGGDGSVDWDTFIYMNDSVMGQFLMDDK